MKVTVKQSAALVAPGAAAAHALEVPPGSRVGDVMGRLGLKPAQQRYILAYVNGERRQADHPLRDGDTLQLFLPVAGG